ncbi:hypothetical protein Tco_0895411 [Tanacetum coccineum]|uniref:Uncharacterized protein n=1 Tax=Tanacetum coccineum TaxID=301880 RepID=A0ABQ5CFQ5_9ASTR
MLCFNSICFGSMDLYMEQLWHTLKLEDLKGKFKFFVDKEEFTFPVVDFQTLFQLPQATDNNHADFEEPLELLTMLAFLTELGYAKQIRLAGKFVTTDLPQSWQTLGKILMR